MAELTDRQVKILKTIIEEYIQSAEPVGSETLEKKYELGVSPATIRSEMAKLVKAGYLRQPHASSGRIPTPQAFRFYVNQLLEEKKLSVADEVAAKERVWDVRFDFDKLMHEITRALAEKTKTLALAATEEGNVYHAGYANILQMPEFYDIDITRTVLSLIDEVERVQSLFAKDFGEGPVHILLGEELGDDFLEPCGMVFTHFKTGSSRRGSLGVIGPNRLDYPMVIPTVRYFGSLVEELCQGF